MNKSIMNLPSPDTLINRELGILGFQRRVLAQADDPAMPLLERLRYLCIVSSNMDEFFEVRVAGLKEQIRANSNQYSPDGLTARQQFRAVSETAHALVDRQYELFNKKIIPELAKHGVHFIRRTRWNETQAAWIRDYFFRELMPVLTPVGLDPSHPFPRVLNKSLNFAVELSGRDAFGRNSGAAVVQAPRSLTRVIRLPEEIAGCEYGFVFLSSILHAHVGELFAGMTVQGCYQFRVTRNSDLFIDDEETRNLRQVLQGELPQRHFGAAVRLEVADNCSESMASFLLAQFELEADDLYQEQGPVNLVRLMQVPDWVDRPDLKFTPFIPALPARLAKDEDIFAQIRRPRCRHAPDGVPHRDRLQADAGADPRRTVGQGGHRSGRADGALRRGSQHQLGRQTRRGRCACRLRRGRPQDTRQAGAGHPTRRRRTAPLCASGHRQLPRPHRPFTLHSEVIAAIHHETELAVAGKPAAIIAKMNALLEPQIIAALYAASQAGVKIDLIIRGVCALKPGIPGLSEHIRVRSVVGRFLEHTRIFYFRDGGDEKVILSSADWGPQLLPSHRNRLPHSQPQAEETGNRGRPETVSARQRAGLGHAVRWQLSSTRQTQRQGLQRAGRTAGATDEAEINSSGRVFKGLESDHFRPNVPFHLICM